MVVQTLIPATWEAEAGELLEPRRWRLQQTEIVPLHFSLGDRVRLHLRKQKEIYEILGQGPWLMPKMPALWEVEVGRLLELRSLRPAWAT